MTSELATLIAAFDWGATALGPIDQWPPNLKALTDFIVRSPVSIALLWGEDGVMIYNDAYALVAGGRHPGLLGSKLREGWPEVADFCDVFMPTCLAGGTLSYKDQLLMLNRTGVPEAVWFDLDFSPVYGDDGRPAGVIAFAVETSARIRAEARLEFLDGLGKRIAGSTDADDILAITTREVGEYLGVAICAYADMDADEDGFTIRGDWAAPGSNSIVGHYQLADFGKLAVKNLSAGEPLIVNDNIAELAPEEAATFQSIGIAATICMPLVKDGRLTALMAIHDRVPRIWSADELAVIGEVTERAWAHVERVAAEAELRVSEDNFRTLARAMPNHVWNAQPDGNLDWFNERVYAYSGASPGQLDGADWTSIVHPDDLAAAAERWGHSLATGETYETEFRLRRADGEWRWHLARAVPIIGPFGKIVRWVGTNTDIQDQKEVTAALADMNVVLERRVTERTAELMQAEDALRQSQKMEAVGQLTGGLAHDFNNLLGGIGGALEMIGRHLADGRTDRVERYIEGAQDSVRRAASLTQRLLAFSRRQTLDPRATDIDRLVGGLEDLVARTVGPGIALEVVRGGGSWLARVDQSQLESAILNLTINARDAMPDGGTLTIATADATLDAAAAAARDLPPGDYLVLTVADQGSGMTPDVAARVFEPFFTTKPTGKGTGLGLSMVHGFARQSGGQVAIVSAPGEGTSVSLYFPRYSGPLTEEEPEVADGGVEAGQGETVLLIDDEEMIRMMVADSLRDAGYRVLEAGDGPGGLALLESDANIDLLITDVGLPGGMNGRQVADAARAGRPDLSILFITGYAAKGAIGPDQLDAGMELMTKPFSITALAARVREILG